MGNYDGYLQGLSLAAILILAPIALQSILSDDSDVVYVLIPGEEETTTIYIENNTSTNDARAPELHRSEVARIASFNIKVFGETKMGKPAVVDALVDEILLVNERELEWAVGALIEQQRVVSEGAGAAGIAAIHANPALFVGKRVGVVICGGNIDPRLLASILNRNMAVDGRIARLRIDISDEPGMLAAISTTIGKCGGNIVEIYHQRLFYDVPAKLAKIDAVIETRGPDHVDEIIAALRAAHFQVRQLDDSAS